MPTREHTSPRRRGGQEPPDEWQDRPEQNQGYDRAVRQGPAGTPQDPLIELDADLAVTEPSVDAAAGDEVEQGGERRSSFDDREALRAAEEVRRRERSAK